MRTDRNSSYLLWVENSDDLCDTSLVECWDNITARGQELQLECLKERDTQSVKDCSCQVCFVGHTPACIFPTLTKLYNATEVNDRTTQIFLNIT